jgi:ABC-type transport system substrate-binding protein
MRKLLSVSALVMLCLTATPAFAHVVEVTTSIGLQDTSDPERLQGAVESAVESVLDSAIAFTPTAVSVTSARVIGERVYLRLLIVDADGEQALRDLAETQHEPDADDEPETGRLVI